MAEVGIDQSKLPGVKEVCRDFAILEDHTLAHSLQEQEIEHHLASNVQRNRLVQRDLRVAKQLQEEDLKAQAQLQKRYKDLEQEDCEIAQEIQEKLAIEAERRRAQEKKDEDIARLLQEKELQEEKRRKKHFTEPPRASAFRESYYYDGDQPRPSRARELGLGFSQSCKLQGDGKTVRPRKEKPRRLPENLEEPEEHPRSEKFLSAGSGRERDEPRVHTEQRGRSRSVQERLRGPPPPETRGQVFLTAAFDEWEAASSHQTRNWEKQSRHQEQLSPRSSRQAGTQDQEAVWGREQGPGERRERTRRPRTPPCAEWAEPCQPQDPGSKPRAVKAAVSSSRLSHREQEWYDAEIARKLQEEELLASQVDMRAAQVAQDEEIARLLMAEEKKAYRKAREREKTSLDKRKHDPEWKPRTAKSAHSKSRDSEELPGAQDGQPARPPPPTVADTEASDPPYYSSQHSSSRHVPKSESSHKGFHYKQ